MHQRAPLVFVLLVSVALSACATQRYGRENKVSATEEKYLTCREIFIEKGKAQEFLWDVQDSRDHLNAKHVLGFFGDLGIGNIIEGNEAEDSGQARLDALDALAVRKGCR